MAGRARFVRLDLRNHSLRAKLFSSFVLLLVMELFTGVISLQSLEAVNRSASTIRDNWLPAITRVSLLIDSVEQYHEREARVFLARSETQRSRCIQDVGKARELVSRLREGYKAVDLPNLQDRDLIKGFDESWADYLKISNRMVTGVTAGGDDYRAAQDDYNDAGRRGIDNTLGYLIEDLRVIRSAAADASTRGQNLYTYTLKFIYFAMVVAIVLSALLGFYLTSIIAQPVSSLTSTMRSMADEQLDVEIPELDRRDELGVMARALNYFKNRLLDRRRLLEEEKSTMVALHKAQRDLIEAEKLASLGRLVAGISHEINTPLGSAYVLATTLVENHRSFDVLVKEGKIRKADLEQFVSLVGRSSDLIEVTLRKASDLVRTFKQVAVDQSSDQRRQFELKEMVQQVEMTIQPLFKKAKHTVQFDIPDGIFLDGYPGPLGQIINNLLSNALTHAFANGEQGLIIISADLVGTDQVKIEVTDNGRGIRPEHIGHIFEPFFTTRLGQGGSG